MPEEERDDYENGMAYLNHMFDEGWLTWESGALVQWIDGQADERGILDYVMYVE